MSDDQEPEDNDDQEPEDNEAAPDNTHITPDATALTEAVRAGVKAVMNAPGSPVAGIVSEEIRRAASEALGCYTSRTGQLHETLNFGISGSAQAAMDSIARAAGGWVNHDFIRRPTEILGVRSFVDLIGTSHGLADNMSPMSHLHQFDGELGRSASVAMDALSGHQSTFDKMLHRYDHGLAHLTGFRSAMDAALAGTNRWISVGGAFGEHSGGLSGLFGAAGLGGCGESLDKLMRTSQQTIQDLMGRSSLVPNPASWMNDVMRGPAESITAMMQSLWPLADRGMRAAQVALRTALRVVRMLERNDLKAREAVKQFLLDWLGFQYPSWDLVCSATLVLMNVGSWLPDGLLSLDYDPRPRLRKLTLAEHRAANRLSIDASLRFRGQLLLSLDQPIRVCDADDAPMPLRELVPDKAAPDPAAAGEGEISDPRILRLWWRFTDREREILREKSQPGVTWPAAAVACGRTAAEGERLRCKARRLARKSADESGNRAAEAV